MRALVTGGAGFLGSHLIDRLLSEGLEVVAVDNLITGQTRNIAHLKDNPNFTFLQHDACQPYDFDRSFRYVFHFASPASPGDFERFPVEILRVGSVGTELALRVAQECGATFVMASTSEVYGDPTVNPQPETYFGNVNPVGPRGVYDEAKRFSEAMTMSFARNFGVDTRIARIFNTYGPRMRANDSRVVPSFISAALAGKPMQIQGDGMQTRSFCYCDDLIDGIWRLTQHTYTEPVNLGADHEITMIELAKVVAETVGVDLEFVHLPLPKDDPKVRRPDLTLARKILDYEPKTSIGDGLVPTLADLKAQLLQPQP